MVEVSAEVKEGIDWINRQGVYNPFATPQIATALQACGFKAAGQWIERNPTLYERGVHEGFVVSVSSVIETDDNLDSWGMSLIEKYL